MMQRRDAIKRLLGKRPGNLFVVPGLGSTCWDLASLGENDRDFYVWGAMGGVAMIGLGLALAQADKRVAVITGDGEMLMGLGSLATIAVKKPPNLSIVVFDNGVYGETGMQPSHTSSGVNLVETARSCGFVNCFDIGSDAELDMLAGKLGAADGLLFARVPIAREEPPRVLPERDGVVIKQRFRRAIGAAP
ncbi:MAG: aldehyde dehydrogenase [Pseudolabrys sp.]|nr:aldehyde dehydrogenase [Pseudolabrys sp.]